jgi:hypothetical protein
MNLVIKSTGRDLLGDLSDLFYNSYDNHDCHLSPEDSCSACDQYFEYIDWLEIRDAMVEGEIEQMLLEKHGDSN